MAASKRMVVALAFSVALAVQAPALAQPQGAPAAGAESAAQARERATNESLLAALLQRRAEMTGSAIAQDDKRAALDWLDKRIAEVRSRLGS